jgi:carbon-monoxide dehydrogenase large subunit
MTTLEERPASAEIGQPRRRKEDAHFITGRTLWTDNITLPGLLHLAILRSPLAHARITSINTAAAAGRPGVVAVFTGQDFAETQGSIPCAWPVTSDIVNPGHPSIAVDQVNHVGEAVAIVVARDKSAAQDALEAIDVDYEPLPVVLDMEAALADGGPLVHPNTESNRCFTWTFESGAAGTGQPIEEVLQAAEVTVSRRFVQQRLIPAFMEPRSTVAQPDGEGITLWSSTQVPHVLRTLGALTLGIPEQKMRVIAPDVGGGFGGKLQITPEEFICTLVARKLGKPVKYTESRSESLMSGHHGRDQIQDITLTARRDGTFTGLDVHILSNMGAYLRLITPGIPLLGAFMFNGSYKFDAYRFVCDGVFTTKTPTDAYRGAGRPEATFAIERIVDEMAVELGMDPMELRRKNWIEHDDFPYTTVTGITYDSGNYEEATDKALALMGWDDLRREQADRIARGDPVRLGLGISTYTELCGWAPSRLLGVLAYAGGGWDHASVRVLPTGKVEVVTGTSPHGQGHETAWSQIVADRLGVPFEDVEILHGDTRTSPRGWDTYGSRSAAVGAIAVSNAALRVIDKAKRIAAHLLEASEDDVEFANGTFSVKGAPGTGKTIQDLAFAAFAAHDIPDGVEPNLDADATFDPVALSFPHGTHLCAVDIDTETGRATIRRYVCVDDVGEVINPLIVDGQVHGGVVQGISQALFEEAVYDADGNLTTGSFVDYLLPSAPDVPSMITDRTVSPSTTNPMGVKGVGETGTIAATPAVVNAILDAVRPFGVTDIPMPCTPERIWRAVNEASDASKGERP